MKNQRSFLIVIVIITIITNSYSQGFTFSSASSTKVEIKFNP